MTTGYEATLLRQAQGLAAQLDGVLREARGAVDQLQHSGPSSIEVRMDEKGRLDEIVGKQCSVHLEDMGGHWCLIVSAPGQRVMVGVGHPKKTVITEIIGPVVRTQGEGEP